MFIMEIFYHSPGASVCFATLEVPEELPMFGAADFDG